MKEGKRQAFQADIAKALGLSQSTVSVGLKGDPRVAPATRAAILKKAAELGYVPDPMLHALARYRKKSMQPRFSACLGWLTNYPERDGWRITTFLRYHEGARKRAESLGYKLEEIWMAEKGMTPSRVSGILTSRGIRGLLLAPQPTFGVSLKLDFSKFASVTFGYTLASPAVHLVSNHQYRSIARAIHWLHDHGYRRIGMMVSKSVDERVDHNLLGGYFATVNTVPGLKSFEPLLADRFDGKRFGSWLKRIRPDAIIITESLEASVHSWCESNGIRIPGDLSLVGFDRYEKGNDLAGIDQRSEAIGAAAVDVLVGMLNRFEYGVPAVPLRVLIEGVWCDGASAPSKLKSR